MGKERKKSELPSQDNIKYYLKTDRQIDSDGQWSMILTMVYMMNLDPNLWAQGVRSKRQQREREKKNIGQAHGEGEWRGRATPPPPQTKHTVACNGHTMGSVAQTTTTADTTLVEEVVDFPPLRARCLLKLDTHWLFPLCPWTQLVIELSECRVCSPHWIPIDIEVRLMRYHVRLLHFTFKSSFFRLLS